MEIRYIVIGKDTKLILRNYELAVDAFNKIRDDDKCIYKCIKRVNHDTGMFVYEGIYIKGKDLYDLSRRNYYEESYTG